MVKSIRKQKKRITTALSAVLLSLAAAGSPLAAVSESVLTSQEQAAGESRGYWQEQAGVWYYYDANGVPVQGWIEENGSYYYLRENGSRFTGGITPDGHFVDAEGRWYPRKTTIFNQEFIAPDTFPVSDTSWKNPDQLSVLRNQIRMVFKERRLKISENAIEYTAVSNKKERVLLGLYKQRENGTFRLDLGVSLNAGSVEIDEPETYDYLVFRALVYEMTSTPDYLERAIYSSWEEENSWKINRETPVWIGDSLVKYEAVSGTGRYQSSAAQP